MTNLTTLPHELLVTILSHLPTASILNCTLVSHFVRDIIASSITLQYSLAKDKAGVEDSLTSQLTPIGTRLDLLRKREANWGNFDYTFRRTVEVANSSTEIYDVTRNAFFLGSGTRAGGAQGVQYARLPRRVEEEVSWREISVGKLVAEFGVSEENDMVALLCYSTENHPTFDIHLQRMSDGAPHPEATEPVIRVCYVNFNDTPPSMAIDICGSTLVLCIDNRLTLYDGPLMYIYNWRLGTMLTTNPVPVLPHTGVVFLQEDIFLLPYPDGYPTLDIYKLPMLPSSASDLDPVVKLELPEINHEMMLTSFMGRSDTSPHSRTTSSAPPSDEYPFRNRPNDALLLFTLESGYYPYPATVEISSFVVHRDRILAIILLMIDSFDYSDPDGFWKKTQNLDVDFDFDEVYISYNSSSSYTCEVPWHAWGPSITRWFKYPSPTAYITASSGLRYARMNQGVVEVLDFGRERVRDCIAHGVQNDDTTGKNEKKGSWTLVSDISTIKTGTFAEDIETSLPYIVTRSEETFEWKEVMMDEERIIGIVDSGKEVTKVDVLYFG